MKSWFHNHRMRKSRPDVLSIQRYESSELDQGPQRPLPALPGLDKAAEIAASHTTNRMSIERYLSAPLEDEPASVPAIDAALKRHNSNKSRVARLPVNTRRIHTRESSYDVNSEGRRTFYTSGSAPDSTGTSYSTASRNNHHQRSNTHPDMPQLSKTAMSNSINAKTQSPERPMTARTVDTEKTWAEQMEMVMPGYSPDKRLDYKARAEAEIARIQEKARVLEEQLRRYKAERNNSDLLVPRITDEMAYERMVEKPKLAWILGGDISDARSVRRPKSRAGSMAANTTDDLPDRPGTSESLVDGSQNKIPRRTKSSGALDEKARRSAVEKKTTTTATATVERKPSKRSRYYCTFCQKRFHSRTEWTRHEQMVHMPEELWVCCPRTGNFPERCPFCSERDPSTSHLADHNYTSCQSKPLSERTFSRKDFFLQHINQEHKVSPGQKPLRLTELLEAWRHPLPLKQGHQALHCGFCGITFKTYKDRMEHVARHFGQGLDMMSWWSARISHEVPAPRDTTYNP
ncbi:hypothetical protein P280DRAFT_156173 [Massarina eburnea CBS 473.64]|uniref:C2H2-type domain-containing protein n=1 Tax=Massarina eburnea CBS 473.64 TaxID=1395130 RepID=A0A6A6RP34_9PLEO|nr:hypothetical protein P280DRAFT_156173 [Massarina eburnea CBS 473.64]